MLFVIGASGRMGGAVLAAATGSTRAGSRSGQAVSGADETVRFDMNAPLYRRNAGLRRALSHAAARDHVAGAFRPGDAGRGGGRDRACRLRLGLGCGHVARAAASAYGGRRLRKRDRLHFPAARRFHAEPRRRPRRGHPHPRRDRRPSGRGAICVPRRTGCRARGGRGAGGPERAGGEGSRPHRAGGAWFRRRGADADAAFLDSPFATARSPYPASCSSSFAQDVPWLFRWSWPPSIPSSAWVAPRRYRMISSG